MKNFGGFQVNIKYDPKMLQAVDPQTKNAFTARTMPTGATILINDEYQPMYFVANDISKGILNFGRTYTYMGDYRAAGKPEESGILAKIGFKVLKEGSTNIKFEDTITMPDAKKGTFVFDWYSEKIGYYDVIQPGKITIVNVTPTATVTPTDSTGDGGGPGGGGPGGGGPGGGVVNPSSSPTPTPTPTPTKKPNPTEIVEPDPDIPAAVGVHYSYLTGYPDKLFRPERVLQGLKRL
ncbi:cohesin domain-containing protein [Acetivibrio straminisolvens]|nr:cohesin domain-containing protein [Acetivibrio straminisolvens]